MGSQAAGYDSDLAQLNKNFQTFYRINKKSIPILNISIIVNIIFKGRIISQTREPEMDRNR